MRLRRRTWVARVGAFALVVVVAKAAFSLSFSVATAFSSGEASVRPQKLSNKLLGIHPAELRLFQKTPDDTFACLATGTVISRRALNDDYCDCPDGSDEPGTSACAHLFPSAQLSSSDDSNDDSQSRKYGFWCANAGYEPRRLLPSRVNDGICDDACCDGSDEWDGRIQCPNRCAEKAAEAKLEKEEKERLLREGVRIKNSYIEHAKQLRLKKRQELEEAQEKLEIVKAEEQEAKAEKERQETLYNIVLKKHKSRSKKQCMAALSSMKPLLKNMMKDFFALEQSIKTVIDDVSPPQISSPVPNPEPISNPSHLDDDGENYGEHFDASTSHSLPPIDDDDKFDAENFDDSKLTGPPPPHDQGTPLKDKWAKFSDTMKRLSISESEVAEPVHMPTAEQLDAIKQFLLEEEPENGEFGTSPLSPRYMDEDELETLPWYKRFGYRFSRLAYTFVEMFKETIGGDYVPANMYTVKQALNSARGKWTELDSKKNQLSRTVDELSQFSTNSYGPDDIMVKLSEECIEFKTPEYIYQMCPYHDAKQNNHGGGTVATLGHWDQSHFDSALQTTPGDAPTIWKFSGGDTCWNGPTRSLTVHVKCGVENKAISVEEPSKCEYKMDITSPVVCRELQGETRSRVKDEL